jgi:hypothetical protein
MDKTWLYHYDLETNNNQWSGGIVAQPAPTPKKSEFKKQQEIPRIGLIFRDNDATLFTDYVSKGLTINSE